jgi:hypothetical protein
VYTAIALPRESRKNTSPIRAGAVVSEGPAPAPWNTLEARRELKDGARPPHIDDSVMSRVAIRSTGRLPNMLDKGTQKIFEAPIMRTETAISCVSCEKGCGSVGKFIL